MAKLNRLAFSSTEIKVIVLLLVLCLIPSIIGFIRLIEVSSHGSYLPHNPRLEASPVPIIVHIVGSLCFSLLGIFQFIPTFRRAFPKQHRFFGYVFIVTSLYVGITGLWMTHFYKFPVDLQGSILYWVRIAVGISMILFTLLGIKNALKRNFNSHASWMIRAYALGQGAGMQAIIGIIWAFLGLDFTGLVRDILMTASWVINILIAERIIYLRVVRAPLIVSYSGKQKTD